MNFPATLAVVVVSKNYDQLLEDTLQSLSQSMNSIDRIYIISPLPTWNNPQHFDLTKFVFLTDLGVGIYEAMNILRNQEGLEDYILFLNAGDVLVNPDYFVRCKSDLSLHTDTVVLISGYKARLRISRTYLIAWFLGERVVRPQIDPKRIKQCSLLVKSGVFKELNGFDLKFGMACDYDFIRKVLAYERTRVIEIISVTFYLDGVSSQNRLKSLKDQNRVDMQYKSVRSIKRQISKLIYLCKIFRAFIIDVFSNR